MKQMRISLISAILCLSAFSCVRMEEEPVEPAGSCVITATLESGAGTRTYLSEPDEAGIYYPCWSVGDAIAVYADGINVADKYTIFDGAGTTKGSFSGRLSGLSLTGVYPYSCRTDEGLSGDKLTISLPAEQTYTEGTFAPESYPMVAAGGGNTLSFKNVCSVLRFSMTGDNVVQSIKFVAHDSWMSVNGKAEVDLAAKDGPKLAMTGDGTNEIILQCGYLQLDTEKPTEFFIVIPPGTYSGGFQLEIKTFRGTVTKYTGADITFRRSQVRSIPQFECDADGEFDPDNLPYNQIWYETMYNNDLGIDENWFDQPIVSHTFSEKKGIIKFAGPVTKIGSYAFNNDGLTAIHLPNSITSIGLCSFNNSSIESFHVPDQLQEVGEYVFGYCNNLNRFYGRLASADGNALILENGTLVAYARASIGKKLVVPDGVKSLSNYIFQDSQIEEAILPEGLERIGYGSFYHCLSLKSVTLPSSLYDVGTGVFSYCQALREFKGSCSLIADGRAIVLDNQLRAVAVGGIEDYTLPVGIRSVSWGVFMGLKDLKSITFQSELDWVNNPLFEQCGKMEFMYGPGTSEDHHFLVIGQELVAVTPVCPKDLVVPGNMGITSIRYGLFADNSSIETLTIPDDVTYIDSDAFRSMQNLKTLVLPAGLTDCGWNMFSSDNALEKVYLRAIDPPSYNEDNWAYAGHDGLTVYVPKGSENRYKSASGWSNYSQYIQGYIYPDLPQADYYVSVDYSHDGEVRKVQTASEGTGIELVFMGDAFSDRQIADGTYDAVMDKMIDAFFGEEPYTTLRPLFNVSVVDVVSSTEGYEHGGNRLECWFGGGTYVGGNDDTCVEYACKAVPREKIDNTLIIVAMNDYSYAGTCWMYYPSDGDCGNGLSVAYFPLGTDDEMLAQLVHHEAGGHGFSKLGDEYAYESQGTIPRSEIDNMNQSTLPYGWWKNCDFTSDPAKVKWSRFLADERYQYDGLGCFEGGLTYWSGVWRPTENSIMRYNYGGFNAPSRESIWYRAHKLAYGDDWQYDYEAFVAYDAINRKTSADAASSRIFHPGFVPTHPPVVIPHSWRDVPAPLEAVRASCPASGRP